VDRATGLLDVYGFFNPRTLSPFESKCIDFRADYSIINFVGCVWSFQSVGESADHVNVYGVLDPSTQWEFESMCMEFSIRRPRNRFA